MRITVLLLWGRALSLNSHCSTQSRALSQLIYCSHVNSQKLYARATISLSFPSLLRSISTFPFSQNSVSVATKFDINSLIYCSKHAKLLFSFSSFLFTTIRHIFFNSIKLSGVLVFVEDASSVTFSNFTRFYRHLEKNSQTEEKQTHFSHPPPHIL